MTTKQVGGYRVGSNRFENTPIFIIESSVGRTSQPIFFYYNQRRSITMSKAIAITYPQFANGLGKQARLLRDTSLVWHMEYRKADAESRKEYLQEWLTQHLMGQLDVTQQVAERILSKSRTDRNKVQNNAYSRAYSDFRYHIIRPETKKDSATSGTVSAQVDVVEQALALVESMTKAQQDKFFKRVTRK